MKRLIWEPVKKTASFGNPPCLKIKVLESFTVNKKKIASRFLIAMTSKKCY